MMIRFHAHLLGIAALGLSLGCGGGDDPPGSETTSGGASTPAGDSGGGSTSTSGPGGAGGGSEGVTQSVGPDGGTIALEGVTLTIPPGALKATTTLGIHAQASTPAGYVAFSPVYRFEPAGLTFDTPVTVSFAGVPADSPSAVYWASASEGPFEQLATSVIDASASAKIAHFSFGFVGKPLLWPGACTESHDKNGDGSADEKWKYVYDAAGRIKRKERDTRGTCTYAQPAENEPCAFKCQGPNGAADEVVEYVYDAAGRLVEERRDEKRTCTTLTCNQCYSEGCQGCPTYCDEQKLEDCYGANGNPEKSSTGTFDCSQ